MNTSHQTETTILDLVRQRDQDELTRIYKDVYPMVLKYVTANTGSREDAQDIFQDAFYILIKKAEHPDFILTSELSTFLVGIAKNLWLKKLTRAKVDLTDYKIETEDEVEESVTEREDEKLRQVRHMSFALTELGEPCKSILVQYYFLKQTMQEIAAIFHYTNAENAKNQKYKCLQRLKKIVIKKNE